MRNFKRFLGPLTAAAVVLVGNLALAAVQPEGGLGLPRDVSVDGHRIDWLMNATHVFNIILFVIMCVWMGIACVKHGRAHTAEYDHGDSKRSTVIALSLSAFIFAVVDGNLFINTVIDLSEAFWAFDKVEANPETVRVELNAHQWSWDFRLAGEDAQFGTDDDVVTWNELKVPTGTPVLIQLASTDVIHSLYLPNFRVKQDAVPGMVNQMWFQARDGETGDFDIGCAQHCGTHHYKMKGKLSVVSKAEYQAWMKEASVNAKRGFDPDDQGAKWAWQWKKL